MQVQLLHTPPGRKPELLGAGRTRAHLFGISEQLGIAHVGSGSFHSRAAVAAAANKPD